MSRRETRPSLRFCTERPQDLIEKETIELKNEEKVEQIEKERGEESVKTEEGNLKGKESEQDEQNFELKKEGGLLSLLSSSTQENTSSLYPKLWLLQEENNQPEGQQTLKNNLLNSSMSNLKEREGGNQVKELTLFDSELETPQINFIPFSQYKHREGGEGGGGIGESEFHKLVQKYKTACRELKGESGVGEEMERNCSNLRMSVWKMEKRSQKQSRECGDGVEVEEEVFWDYIVYQNSIAKQLEESLSLFREKRLRDVSNAIHYSQIYKLYVELFLEKFLSQSFLLFQLDENSQVTSYPLGMRNETESSQILHLRSLIDTLFFFEREEFLEKTGEGFGEEIRKQINRLVSVLLRKADFSDHLFLLQQLLLTPHCGEWASHFISFPPHGFWSHDFFPNFFCQMLDNFLHPFSKSLNPSPPFFSLLFCSLYSTNKKKVE